jgi:hypothetical protein
VSTGETDLEELWNELTSQIDAQQHPGSDLKELGEQLLHFLDLGDEWRSRLADGAVRNAKIATALEEALLLRERTFVDLVGLDRLVECWCEALGDGPGESDNPWNDWPAQVMLGLIPRLGSFTTLEAWGVVMRLLDAAPNEWVIANIGSGPLENLLSADPEVVAGLIEDEAPIRPRLREALVHTWQLFTPDIIFARVKRLAEPHDDEL